LADLTSETELGESRVEGLASLVGGSFRLGIGELDLPIVELLRLLLSVFLELSNELSLGPSSEFGEVTHNAGFSVRLHAADLEG